MLTTTEVEARRAAILADIAVACEKSGRDPSTVRIVGVTKYVGEDALPALLDAGIYDLGENRLQQAREKFQSQRAAEATWHFIGHLQRNKARDVVQCFDWIHSIDSTALAQAISSAAAAQQKVVRCLMQVNVSGEATKSGLAPEQVYDTYRQTCELPGLVIAGLMTMAPLTEDTTVIRNTFRGLSQLLQDLRGRTGDSQLQELSMGMSNDYSIAVEEGATLVRIGHKLVG